MSKTFQVFEELTTNKKYCHVDYHNKNIFLSNDILDYDCYIDYKIVKESNKITLEGCSVETIAFFFEVNEFQIDFYKYREKLLSKVKKKKRFYIGETYEYLEAGWYKADDEYSKKLPKHKIEFYGTNYDVVIQ